MKKRKAVPNIWGLGWQRGPGGFLLKQFHKTSASDKTTLRPRRVKKEKKKKDHCVTMFEHIQDMDIIPSTNSFKILPNIRDCWFFIDYSFNLALVFPFSGWDLPRHSIIEILLLLGSIHSRKKPTSVKPPPNYLTEPKFYKKSFLTLSYETLYGSSHCVFCLAAHVIVPLKQPHVGFWWPLARGHRQLLIFLITTSHRIWTHIT